MRGRSPGFCGGGLRERFAADHTNESGAPAEAGYDAAAAGGSSPLVATLTAPTHAPKAGEPWPYTIRATNRAGKPIEGTATVTVVAAAGQVIDGVGIFDAKRVIEQTYRWPRVDRGRALVFQVEISALESTKIVRYPVRVQ